MLKATGLRYPGRVVGAGGIYLELDSRDVPDVATVVANYHEGCQGLITATMCNEASRIEQVIRGRWGPSNLAKARSSRSLRSLPSSRR